MIREQANKTMDIFLHRVRKYAQTLPDTVLPPLEASAQSNQPRMGTAQAEGSSWAGWAISSFTNTIASVSGQMQEEASNGTTADQRPSSVPLPARSGLSRPPPSTSSVQSIPTSAPAPKSSKPNPFSSKPGRPQSPEPEVDFDNGWGEAENAWGDDDDPFSPKSAEKPATTASNFDDSGEPDFEGWLNAQSRGKQGPKKPLPKGLTKAGSSRPALPKSNSTGGSNLKKTVIARAPIKKKDEAKPKAKEDEEEGWGDAWD
jgi:SCY1-like protein 1